MKFKEDKIAEFLVLFDSIKEEIKNFEGCQGLHLLQDKSDPSIICTYSIWESDFYLNEYRQSDFFEEVWPKTKKLFKSPASANSFKKIV